LAILPLMFIGKGVSITEPGDEGNISITAAKSSLPELMNRPPDFRPFDSIESPESHLNRGITLVGEGYLEKALKEFTLAIEMDPEYSQAYANRAGVYLRQGEFQQAIADSNTALSLDQNLALAYLNRGLAYASRGSTLIAIGDFQKALFLTEDPSLITRLTTIMEALSQ